MGASMRRDHRERGATAVEYALVIGLVSLLVIAGPVALGGSFVEWSASLVGQVGDLLP